MTQAFKTKCIRKLLCISYLEHKTNDWMWSMMNFLVGLQEPLLATVKRRKLSWFGNVACHKKCWMDIPDIPAHARTAHKVILLEGLEKDLC